MTDSIKAEKAIRKKRRRDRSPETTTMLKKQRRSKANDRERNRMHGLNDALDTFDQETAKGPFRSSSQAATCYYQSNHSKIEAIPCLAQGHSKRTYRLIFTLFLINAERQAVNTKF